MKKTNLLFLSFIIIFFLLACDTERKKKVNMLETESTEILSNATTKLLIDGVFTTDQTNQIIKNYTEIFNDSAELGYEYAIHIKNIANDLDYRERFAGSPQQKYKEVQSTNTKRPEISKTLYSVPRMSTWDGMAYTIKDYLKENANDPRSIKYIGCSPLLEFKTGLYGQRVKFRGKNAFGALVVNESMFIIKENGINTKVIAKYSMKEFAILGAQGKFIFVASYDATGKKIK